MARRQVQSLVQIRRRVGQVEVVVDVLGHGTGDFDRRVHGVELNIEFLEVERLAFVGDLLEGVSVLVLRLLVVEVLLLVLVLLLLVLGLLLLEGCLPLLGARLVLCQRLLALEL